MSLSLGMKIYHIHRYLLACSFLRLYQGEITLKSKIVAMVEKGNLKGAQKLCKLKLDLSRLYNMEINRKQNSNQFGLQNAIDYLSTEIDKIEGKCEAFLSLVKPQSSNMFNTSNGDTTMPKASTAYKYETRRDQVNGFDISLNETNDHYERFDMHENGDDAMEMADYVDSLEGDAADQALCEECKMDYDDKESVEFDHGMTDEENTETKGTNKLVVFFSSVGIGLVLVIVAVSLVAHFGIKKIKSYLKRSNDDATPNSRYNEAYEMS